MRAYGSHRHFYSGMERSTSTAGSMGSSLRFFYSLFLMPIAEPTRLE